MAKMVTLGARDSRQSVDYAMGTFAWAAPEMLMGEGLTPAVDVYSLGVVLWEIVTSVRSAPCRPLNCYHTSCTAGLPEQMPAKVVRQQLSRLRQTNRRYCYVRRCLMLLVAISHRCHGCDRSHAVAERCT